MHTVLDRLLKALESVPADVSCRANNAFNSFPLRTTLVADKAEYESLLDTFQYHVECAIWGAKTPPPNDMSIGLDHCEHLLKEELGPNPRVAGVDVAMKSGVLPILRSCLDLTIKAHTDQQIGTLVSEYWRGRSAEELLADSTEYLDKHGHLLPPELTEGSAARIRVNFMKVLKEHPHMMRRMRQIGR